MGRGFVTHKRQFAAAEGHDRSVGVELKLALCATHASTTTTSAHWHRGLLPCATRPKAWRRRKSPPPITIHQPALSSVEGSLITAFLIDTPPIRIASKPFPCFIVAQSNRHSLEPLSAGRLSFNSFISSTSFTSSRSQSASSTRVTSSVCYAPVSQANKRG